MESKATALWEGNLKEGSGKVSTASKALNNQAYSFKTRFEGETGTNPEELIAAAHAACFSMALSHGIAEAGFKPQVVETNAKVTLSKVEAGFKVSNSDLVCKAIVPQLEQSKFNELAEDAKQNCPISKLLNTEITLNATLEN